MIIRKIEPKAVAPAAKRVAAYARVSTKKEEQEESYETQKAVYQKLIEETPGWEFAGIYADKGKSATSVKHRPGFLSMIADAEAGKLDIILVKSISRFARNVGNCQEYADRLRMNDVTVIFEKENIRTDDPTSNFTLAMIGAVSQDESNSIGLNRRWAYQKRFANGEFNLGNNRILGYDTVDGKLVPNGDAWIIREIFEKYVGGASYAGIARSLAEKGAKTLRGGDFTVEAVRYILGNETYVGDKHLQKRPPTDYLTHQPVKGTDYQDYYLTDDHEGIVDRETWDKAQTIKNGFKENLKNGIMGAGEHHFLYGKVFCGECGAPFVRRTLKTTGGVYRKVWNCRERQKGKKGNGCRCRFVTEDDLIAEITKVLGWEQMNELKFAETVKRVLVDEGSVRIDF